MAICEFENGCTVKALYEKRVDLVHTKTGIFIEITEGPDDLNFVSTKMTSAKETQKEIDNLDMQIGAQIVCSKCPWR